MPAIVSTLKRKLKPTDSEERCGVVLRSGKVLQCENTHPEPAKGFRINAVELLKHEDDLVGTWHTHPGQTAVLSEEDYFGFRQWPDLTHYIVGTNGVRAYRIVDNLAERVDLD